MRSEKRHVQADRQMKFPYTFSLYTWYKEYLMKY
jgi:hypothetical protein